MTGPYPAPVAGPALDLLVEEERLCECGAVERPDEDGLCDHDDACPARDVGARLRRMASRSTEA